VIGKQQGVSIAIQQFATAAGPCGRGDVTVVLGWI
jgi:hypothetical protein